MHCILVQKLQALVHCAGTFLIFFTFQSVADRDWQHVVRRICFKRKFKQHDAEGKIVLLRAEAIERLYLPTVALPLVLVIVGMQQLGSHIIWRAADGKHPTRVCAQPKVGQFEQPPAVRMRKGQHVLWLQIGTVSRLSATRSVISNEAHLMRPCECIKSRPESRSDSIHSTSFSKSIFDRRFLRRSSSMTARIVLFGAKGMIRASAIHTAPIRFCRRLNSLKLRRYSH